MRLSRIMLRRMGLGAAVASIVGAGAGWFAYESLNDNIRTDSAAARALAELRSDRPGRAADGSQNILIMGSDNPEYVVGAKKQTSPETVRSDTTMLLHIDGDGTSAAAVNVPRDLLVEVPRCRRHDGSYSMDQRLQFNWAFQTGGAACTIRAVEELTDIRVDHHIVVDFQGFKRVIDALGGVEVNLAEAEHDPNVGLDLPAGRQLLRGEDALAYVRARQYVGDGGDINRIARQQKFLRLVADKARSGGTLSNPAKLYPVLDAATSSLTTDRGLGSLKKLYALAKVIQGIPAERIAYLTVPTRPYPEDPDRLVLKDRAAGKLFTALRTGKEL